jgi:hypothetical protein
LRRSSLRTLVSAALSPRRSSLADALPNLTNCWLLSAQDGAGERKKIGKRQQQDDPEEAGQADLMQLAR